MRSLFRVFLLVIVVFTSYSCTNDKITKNDVIGTFEGVQPSLFEKVKYKISTHVNGFVYRGKLMKKKDYLYFYADGKYLRKKGADSLNSGTWEIKDNSELIVNIPWNSNKDSSYKAVYKLNNHKLFTIKKMRSCLDSLKTGPTWTEFFLYKKVD